MKCTVCPLFSDELLQNRYSRGRYRIVDVVAVYWGRLCKLLSRHKFDLILIEKEAFPWLPAWFERGLFANVPYVLDYDDAIFHNYDRHPFALVKCLLGQKIDRLMGDASLVLAGNQYLAGRAREAGAPWVEVVPTVIDLNRYSVRFEAVLEKKSLLVVWIGSPSTTNYLQIIAKPLAILSTSFPLRLRVIGGGEILLPGVEIERVPWREADEVSLLQDCDVGIMPLHDSPWERGKCGYKLIQYMGCGLPVVASPVGVNKEIVQHGQNGFLAQDETAWLNAFTILFENEDLRYSMGAEGRKRVEENYCVQHIGPRLIQLIRQIAST